MVRGRTFRLDRQNGKIFGVCAGISNYTGWDATLVRVGVVLVTLLGAFPWTLIAYGAAALVARSRQPGEPEAVPALRTSAYELRQSEREIDRRIAEVESFVSSSSSRLSQDIESLR